MPNTTTSPNMQLVLPVPLTEIGPAWANELYTALNVGVDAHDHSSTKGVKVTPLGLNINADLGFTSFNATALRSARFTAQGSPLGLGTDKGCIYVSGVDLWYNDTGGNQIRLTNTGNANFTFLAYPERTPAISGNFTILSTDAFVLYYIDTSSVAATLNLPASSALAVGRTYIGVDIKRNANANNISVVPNGTDKINGVNATYTVTINGTYFIVTTDGAGNWYANTWGGFDPLNIASNLQWVSGQSSPTLKQSGTGPASGTAQSITIQPQGANATNGTGGDCIVTMSTGTGTGAEAYFRVIEGAQTTFAVGWQNTAQQNAQLWLSLPTTSTTDWSLAHNNISDQTTLNSNTSVAFAISTSVQHWMNASGFQFFGSSANFGSGTGVVGVNDRTAAPSANPSGGLVLYSEGGASKFRGSGGAITTATATGSGTQNSQANILDKTFTRNRTTTSGSTFTVDTAIPTNQNVYIRATVIARNAGGGTGTAGDALIAGNDALYRNVSGTVTLAASGSLVNAKTGDANMVTGSGIAWSVSGTNGRLTVTAPTGEGATPTVDWETLLEILVD